MSHRPESWLLVDVSPAFGLLVDVSSGSSLTPHALSLEPLAATEVSDDVERPPEYRDDLPT